MIKYRCRLIKLKNNKPSILTTLVQQLTKAIELALDNKNWHAALTVALTLPDICGKLESPQQASVKIRYSNWYDKYFKHGVFEKLPEDIRKFVSEKDSFLNGKDCYLLRCAYLHSGTDDITDQSVKKAELKGQQIDSDVLTRFHFSEPGANFIHYNKIISEDGVTATLQLQIDEFCKDMCNSVKKWEEVASKSDSILERMNQLLKIHDYGNL